MLRRALRRMREQANQTLWLPGWLLLGALINLFLIMHLHSIGWAAGLLNKQLRGYWVVMEWLIGPRQLYAGSRAPEHTLHRLLLAGVLVLLGACYLFALLRVRRAPGRVSLRAILAWTAIFCVPLLLLPNIFSNDIHSYLFFGRIAAVYQGNPFADPPNMYANDPYLQYVYWRTMPSVYGPVWIMFSHGLTLLVEALGGGLWLYVLGYKLLATLPHLLNVVLIWMILGRWKPQQQALGTLFYAWSPLALIEFPGSAHNDVLMITFLLATVWFQLRQRPYLALAALVGAILVKWVALVLLPLYGLLVLAGMPGWRARARHLLQGAALSLALMVLAYAPYWTGLQTLQVLSKAPPATRTINSLGDLAISELQQRTQVVGSVGQADLQAALRPQNRVSRPAKMPEEDLALEEQYKRFQRAQSERTWQAISQAKENAKQKQQLEQHTRRLGNVLLVLVWLWAVWRVCRRPDLETLLSAWAWVLFTYICFTAVWFWPWYGTWFVALAALLDGRRTRNTALIFSLSVLLLYVTFPANTNGTPALLERYRALLMFGPPLLYLAISCIIPWCRPRGTRTLRAGTSRRSSSVQPSPH